jgi:hypothetical protein
MTCCEDLLNNVEESEGRFVSDSRYYPIVREVGEGETYPLENAPYLTEFTVPEEIVETYTNFPNVAYLRSDLDIRTTQFQVLRDVNLQQHFELNPDRHIEALVDRDDLNEILKTHDNLNIEVYEGIYNGLCYVSISEVEYRTKGIKSFITELENSDLEIIEITDSSVSVRTDTLSEFDKANEYRISDISKAEDATGHDGTLFLTVEPEITIEDTMSSRW